MKVNYWNQNLDPLRQKMIEHVLRDCQKATGCFGMDLLDSFVTVNHNGRRQLMLFYNDETGSTRSLLEDNYIKEAKCQDN